MSSRSKPFSMGSRIIKKFDLDRIISFVTRKVKRVAGK
jgi:hypothetical protein